MFETHRDDTLFVSWSITFCVTLYCATYRKVFVSLGLTNTPAGEITWPEVVKGRDVGIAVGAYSRVL